jgi:hypothetical protein
MAAESPGLLAEHGTLLRHWGGVQARVSHQMWEQQRHCAALQAEVLQWRVRWLLATTQMAWGLGWPHLAPVPASVAAAETPAPRTAADVLCQTGCAGHAHPWRGDEGQCRLSGGDCTRVPPQEAAPRLPVHAGLWL